MAKYDSLTRFLLDQPAARTEITLSFSELENVLGHSLPPTARVDRPWWANTHASNHGRRWLAASWRVARVDLAGAQVTFDRGQPRFRSRVSSSTSHGRPGGAYEGLREFLANVPDQQHQVAVTLAELAELAGRPLPPTALRDVCWWANTHSGSPQAAAWLEAGWFVDRIYLASHETQIVVFRRKGQDPLRSIPRYVKSLLDGGWSSTRPDAWTLHNWIRVCRTIGWYFEGTILYERGGVSLDVLSDVERVELDEDYGICKRELNRYRVRSAEVRGTR